MQDALEKNTIDLLCKPEFKQWVLNPTKESNYYWQKWMEENPNQKIYVQRAREVLLRMRYKQRQLEDQEENEMLDNIIFGSSRKLPKHNGSLQYFIKIAAAVLILLVTGVSFYFLDRNNPTTPKSVKSPFITKSTPSGVKSRITLPDGSKVVLNAESKITYPRTYGDSTRVVSLSGEAFFDVQEDASKPFTVVSKSIKTTALGTSFNVNAYPNAENISIALVTGKVAVKKTGSKDKDYVLKPGEKITFDDRNEYEHIATFDILREIGWKDGVLLFENTGFNEFIGSLERWYGIDILVEGTPHDQWNVDGKFVNESLEEILIGVKYTHNIDYEIKDKSVKIRFN